MAFKNLVLNFNSGTLSGVVNYDNDTFYIKPTLQQMINGCWAASSENCNISTLTAKSTPTFDAPYASGFQSTDSPFYYSPRSIDHEVYYFNSSRESVIKETNTLCVKLASNFVNSNNFGIGRTFDGNLLGNPEVTYHRLNGKIYYSKVNFTISYGIPFIFPNYDEISGKITVVTSGTFFFPSTTPKVPIIVNSENIQSPTDYTIDIGWGLLSTNTQLYTSLKTANILHKGTYVILDNRCIQLYDSYGVIATQIEATLSNSVPVFTGNVGGKITYANKPDAATIGLLEVQ